MVKFLTNYNKLGSRSYELKSPLPPFKKGGDRGVILRVFFLCFCLFFMTSCSSNAQVGRVVEQFGDVSLRDVRTGRVNYYIGLSQSSVSFDEAFQGALSNAYVLISHELGIHISVSTLEVTRILESSHHADLSYILHRDIAIESEHTIQTRINRLYYEKRLRNDVFTHSVWIELYFNRERFLFDINEFWTSEIRLLRGINLSRMDQRFIENFQRMLGLRERFEQEKRYLPIHIITDFENGYDYYRSNFNNNLRHISVENINSQGKFSNRFTFRVRNSQTNEVLANFPLKINNEILFTNQQGILNFTADYNHEIVMRIRHDLDKYLDPATLIIYRNSSFTPMFNQNVTLRIDSDSSLARNMFENLMKNRQFRIGDDYDILLVIRAVENTRLISVNQHLADVRLEIDIHSRARRFITRDMSIPSDRNESIRGHGRTERDALINAYSLEWFGNQQNYFRNIERIIREELLVGRG